MHKHLLNCLASLFDLKDACHSEARSSYFYYQRRIRSVKPLCHGVASLSKGGKCFINDKISTCENVSLERISVRDENDLLEIGCKNWFSSVII